MAYRARRRGAGHGSSLAAWNASRKNAATPAALTSSKALCRTYVMPCACCGRIRDSLL